MITHPQAILGVYDFLLSDEYSQSYIKNVLALPFIMAGMEVEILKPKKVCPFIIKSTPHGSGWLIKAC